MRLTIYHCFVNKLPVCRLHIFFRLYENMYSYMYEHFTFVVSNLFFFNLYAFILLTSTIVPGIIYFVVITHPLHKLQVRRRSSSSCYDRNI